MPDGRALTSVVAACRRCWLGASPANPAPLVLRPVLQAPVWIFRLSTRDWEWNGTCVTFGSCNCNWEETHDRWSCGGSWACGAARMPINSTPR